uniref:Uncharacterized protein n=1 Tax=Oryza barthii TaxID=65489 RepID=A0A0D3FK57_9ORYZ
MLCGTASFKHVVDDDDPAARGTGGGSPRQPRRKHGGGGGGKINPYAERGLDKFSTVLSELEARRDKILRRVGSGGGLVMVRFVQSNGALEPIIVKLPDEQRRPKDDAAAKKPQAVVSVDRRRPAAGRRRRARDQGSTTCAGGEQGVVVLVGADAAAGVLLAGGDGADAGVPRRVREGVRHMLHLHLVVPRAHPAEQRRRRRRGRGAPPSGLPEEVAAAGERQEVGRAPRHARGWELAERPHKEGHLKLNLS